MALTLELEFQHHLPPASLPDIFIGERMYV